MKLRFRVAAVFLAVFLVLGMSPASNVYATEDPVQIELSDSGQIQEAESVSSTDLSDQLEVSIDPTDTLSVSADEQESDEFFLDNEQEVDLLLSPDLGDTIVTEEQDGDLEETIDADFTDTTHDDELESSTELTELQDTPPDTATVDLDALTQWAQDYPELLNSLYAGETDAIAALAAALEADEEVLRAYIADLKDQNDRLVQAMESGTDVLNTISMNSPENAARALGVDATAINLFRIKLGYVSGLISAACDDAEENDQLNAWYQQLGKALGDEESLSVLAENYDVEPAVLSALLQTMGIDAISSSNSLTLKNSVLDAPEGKTHTFIYVIIIWDRSYGNYSSYRGLQGTYGDVTFSRYRFPQLNLTDTFVLPAGYYGYAMVTVNSGESRIISDLPDSYGYCIYQYVSESVSDADDNDSQYYLKDLTNTSGSVNSVYSTAYESNATGKNIVEYTYGYALSYLRLGTEVYSSDPSSLNDEFEFTIYLYRSGTDRNLPLYDQDTVDIETVSYGTNGVEAPNLDSSIKFSKTGSIKLPGLSVSGIYNVATVRLKHGQSVVLKNLGTNYGFYIVGDNNIHYLVGNYGSRIIYTGATSHNHSTDPLCSHTNQYIYKNNVGDDCIENSSIDFMYYQVSLSITKKVVNSDTTRGFVFNVFLARMDPDTYGYVPLTEGDYTLTRTSGTETTTETIHIQTRSDISHDAKLYTDRYGNEGSCEWSVIQLRISSGETIDIKGLPEGVIYDIVEIPVDNYTVSATAIYGTVGASGNVYTSYDYLYDDESVVFTNTYVPPEGRNLAISKTVTGNMSDVNRAFTFQITLTDQNGEPLGDEDIMVQLPNQTETARTTDANGTLTVSLKHSQKITLEDLPQGTRYTITETGADSYTTTFVVTGGSYNSLGGQTLSGALDGEDNVDVRVINSFDLAVPTGIPTETTPYVLMLAFATGGLLLLILYSGVLSKARKKEII